MTSILEFVYQQLMQPLKKYKTNIQEAVIRMIAEEVDRIYGQVRDFPLILNPATTMQEILYAIAASYNYRLPPEADMQEQVDVLATLAYVYRLRGSIDSIENMKRYFSGSLPASVQVKIPSYDLFRYSVSPMSGTHVYQDNYRNRPGVYEIWLRSYQGDIDELEKFLYSELVAAGCKAFIVNNILADTQPKIVLTVEDPIARMRDVMQAEDYVIKIYDGESLLGWKQLDEVQAYSSLATAGKHLHLRYADAEGVFGPPEYVRELPDGLESFVVEYSNNGEDWYPSLKYLTTGSRFTRIKQKEQFKISLISNPRALSYEGDLAAVEYYISDSPDTLVGGSWEPFENELTSFSASGVRIPREQLSFNSTLFCRCMFEGERFTLGKYNRMDLVKLSTDTVLGSITFPYIERHPATVDLLEFRLNLSGEYVQTSEDFGDLTTAEAPSEEFGSLLTESYSEADWGSIT